MKNELLAKIRQIRTESNTAGKTKRNNTKSPIYSRIEQDKVLGRINSTLDSQYSLFWRISVATGWRTADVCNLSFDSIDFTTGKATIIVAKQTKAAESRAFNKVLKAEKESMKQQAFFNGNIELFAKIDQTDYKDITKLMTSEQQAALEEKAIIAVSNSAQKIDTKQLPKSVLEELAVLKEKNIFDNYVFSRRMMKSNRAKSQEGCITRQAVWAALKTVFNWFAQEVNSQVKLSVYSSRKTFAYRMLKGVSGKENNISEVMQAFGHSSLSMTFKYLGLESLSEKLQAQMVGE